MPLALRELQAAFADHVAGRDQADLVAEVVGDSMSAEARLRIHRHHVAHSLGSALAATFATVHALVGEAFFRDMAQRFIGQTQPVQPVLAEYGADFPAFVAGYQPAASLPYLADIARLDSALNVAFHSPAGRRLAAADLAGIAAEKLPSLSLALPEGATLIGSQYPLDRIWNAAQPGAPADTVDLGDGRADLLVLRRSDDAAFVVLALGEAAFIAALIDGELIQEAADRGSRADPSFDLSTAFARLLGFQAFAALQQDENKGG
jgi:hypothetical protein